MAKVLDVLMAGLVLFGFSLACLWALIRNGPKFFYQKDRKTLPPKLPLPDMKTAFIKVNGVSLFTVQHGEGSGKPLMLFVHGFPESWFTWHHLLKAFAGDFHVVAFNLRGYGPSEAPKDIESYRLKHIVEDVECLIEALGHKKCILVGHDWGSTISWEVARKHPNMVQQLITMSAPPGWKLLKTMNESPAQKKKSMYMSAFQLPLLPELLLACNDFQAIKDAFTGPNSGIINPKHQLTDADVEQFKATFSYPGSLTAALNYYRALMRGGSSGGRSKTERGTGPPAPIQGIPCMQLWSDKDMALTADCFTNPEEWATDIKLLQMKNCSHWTPLDQPEEVCNLIRQFLKEKAS